MNFEHQLRVQDLNVRYAETIDEDRLESWPDFFRDDGRYLITTAENVAQKLPIGMMYATSRAMLRDRIKALRQANIYEAQRYRHVIGAPRLVEAGDGTLRARTSFMVARIMHSGETMLFATGCYDDCIVLDGDNAVFAEKTVIIDSRQVDTLLAIPL
ncbi:MAG TPA: aromatic-ring-hydroxylating dioxygenase subunit beta [Xanthobacteraceae bacterium]|nr:aromatic-ring-hydroxylating dioxygenase subunit beta [Xanthobacteraceae bacterium]